MMIDSTAFPMVRYNYVDNLSAILFENFNYSLTFFKTIEILFQDYKLFTCKYLVLFLTYKLCDKRILRIKVKVFQMKHDSFKNDSNGFLQNIFGIVGHK